MRLIFTHVYDQQSPPSSGSGSSSRLLGTALTHGNALVPMPAGCHWQVGVERNYNHQAPG